MFRQMTFALGLSLAASAAFAQTATDAPEAPAEPETAAPSVPAAGAMDADAIYEAARNQLGIIKYCQEQGFTGPEAVAGQEKMLGMLPSGDAAAGDAAEQKGAEGKVVAAGQEIAFEEAAKQGNTTVEAQCKQLETAVNEVVSQLPE